MDYTQISSTSWPLLGLLQLVPLLAGLILIRLRGRRATLLAIGVSVFQSLLALLIYALFDTSLAGNTFQFAEEIGIFGAFHYHAAVDGVSVVFLLLTALLGFISIIFVILRNLHNSSILAVMLLIQSTLMGQFLTVDLLWFSLLSWLEVTFITYLSMRWATIWDARLMIIRFLQFMGISLSLFLAGTFMFGWLHAYGSNGDIQRWSFDLFDLVHLSLRPETASILFFLLFYGLAIRIPIFPMHGWLPLFITHGNIAVGPILFLGLKVGIYGLIRFILPLLPDAVMQWQELIIGMALFGIFYAAFLATRQNNLRRLLAFAIISHSSILLIALFSLNKEGFMGSIFLALNFGLAISSLLVMTGLIWQRTGTIDINKLGGLFNIIPFVGVAFLLASLAIIGMPLTPGFDGVHLMLEASIHRFGGLVAIAASIGNVIAAAFLLRAFQRAFLSTPKKTVSWNMSPMYLTEIVLAGTVIIATLSVGFHSKPWLELINTATEPLGTFYDALHEKQKISEREEAQENLPSPSGNPITIPVHTKGI